jgi:poly(3-hydroxybutyrate) depolymerase
MKQFLLTLGVIGFLYAPAQQVAKGLTASNNVYIGFYEYKPVGYTTDPEQKYPLIIFLHGMGERGNGMSDLPKVKAQGIPKYINAGHPMRFKWNGKSESFVVLSPQLSASYSAWQNFYAEEMVKYAKQNLNIDTNRIIVTGLSLGGGGVWNYAGVQLKNAQQLAAIGAVCPTYPWVDFCNIAKANLPTWAFHALDDKTVGAYHTQNVLNKIYACPPKVVPYATFWPTGGHGIWDRAYDTTYKWQNPNLFEWFLAQNKSLPVNSRPKANAGSDFTISTTNGKVNLSALMSSDEDGTIVRYIWRKISGPAYGSITTPVSEDGFTTVSGLSGSGTYQFELKAVDDRADYTLDTIAVTVLNGTVANIPPVTEAGENQVIYTTRTQLKGSGSFDPDGTITSYKWTLVDGPAQYSITNENAANPEIYNLGSGTYKFELEATDNLGAKNKDTVVIMETSMVLGVKLVSFAGKQKAGANLLTWTTETEFRNKQFEIERSIDGRNFETIGIKKGYDASIERKVYSFTDENASSATTFYRLKQVSVNGKYEYSSIIAVTRTSVIPELVCYPNPASTTVNIQLRAGEAGRIITKLYDISGKVIESTEHNKNTESSVLLIDISTLFKGLYILEVQVNDQAPITTKIVKQ